MLKAPNPNTLTFFSAEEKRTGRTMTGMSELKQLDKFKVMILRDLVREACDEIFGPATDFMSAGGPVFYNSPWNGSSHCINIQKYINFSDGQYRDALRAYGTNLSELIENVAIELQRIRTNKAQIAKQNAIEDWHLTGVSYA